MYFSMKTRPSPKADVASLWAIAMDRANASGCSTMRIPLPPPPAAALISTG